MGMWTYMWGDYELLQFYPRNWGVGCIGSGQSLVVYLLVWQYWMWFSFILLINAYFLFLFRTLSFRRADIRGRRGSGDKRRSAWPEIFTCFFPLLWCFNILILVLPAQTVLYSCIHVLGYMHSTYYVDHASCMAALPTQ